MKRLAGLVVAVGVMGLVGTAMAEPAGSRGAQRGCRQRAETLVRTGVEGHAYLDVGIDTRESLHGFACYTGPEAMPGDGPFAGVLSVWADPENGVVGYSCAKRKAWTGLQCDYTAYSLPVQATTVVEHPYGPWGVSVLGIDFDYAFGTSDDGFEVGPVERCGLEQCVAVSGTGARTHRDLQYRALGWQCTVDHESRCHQADGPAAVAAGEHDPEPTVAVGDLELDLPALCVQASPDVRC